MLLLLLCQPWLTIDGTALADAPAAVPTLAQDKVWRAARIVKATEDGDWAAAYIELDAVPELHRYVLWRRLLESDDAIAFDTYLDFIEHHQDWPRLEALRRRAEAAIDENVGTSLRLDYFERFPALSRDGRLRLIEALLAEGRTGEVPDLVRRTWIENGFTRSEQRDFLRAHASLLQPEDHRKRLHRLLWDGRSAEAQGMFDFVGKGDQAIATARIRLQQMSKGVDSAIVRVPQQLARDPGLLFDRMLWRRRKGRDADAREILLDPPDDLGQPDLWWGERERQVYKLLGERRFIEAATLAERHGQSEGLPFAEAEWLSGWLALRFADAPQQALDRFERLHAAVGTPISLGRAAYWAARASDAAGDGDEAESWYRRAAQHATSFYGQEAAAELGITPDLALPPLAEEAGASGLFTEDSRATVVRMLCMIDARHEALLFLRQMLASDVPVARAMQLAAECGRPEIFLDVVKRGVRNGVLDATSSYPLPGLPALVSPATDHADAALVLAMARQESQFAIDARSPAGALGLMQLMPATARSVARRLGMPFAEHRLRYDPDYNVRIAGAYLDGLLIRYPGADYLSIAAYNAGPGSVERWVRRHGDPRRMSQHERIDWLELIPYAETRNYVQRVLEGRRTYSAILNSVDAVHIRSAPLKGPLVPQPEARPAPASMRVPATGEAS